MESKAKWIWISLGVAIFCFAVLMIRPIGLAQGLCEYLVPTTVEFMLLPSDCLPTNELPSAGARRLIENQRRFYRLSLQRIVVCRTPRKFPQIEPDFTNTFFDQKTRDEWLPLYIGCCSYQYRRHVTVVVAEPAEKGTVITQAALIQSRFLFLRLNWAKAKF